MRSFIVAVETPEGLATRSTLIFSRMIHFISVQLLCVSPPSLLGSKQGFDDRLDLFHFVETKKYACNFAFAV